MEYEEFNKALKFNIITAITRSTFEKPHAYKPLKTQMKESGLLSRFIPFSYTYEPTKIDRLFGQIKGKLTGNPITLSKILNEEREIQGNPEEFSRFEKFSVALGRNVEGFGFRPQRHFQRLAKAHALMRGGKSVETEDIDKILQLINWINFRFNPL